MMINYFFYGLSFFVLGLAAFLRIRQGGEFPLRKHLPWLAAFGFAVGATGWIDMFLAGGELGDFEPVLRTLLIVSHPISGLLLLKFGWGIFKEMLALPAWTIFIPGVFIVPIAYVITYAATTFITPSPIEIPIDIWSRYLLYLPGSILAAVGFLRQWHYQGKLGFPEVSRLMLAAGLAFVFEAIVVGLIVPAAPYGPASYYNYDRVSDNAFTGELIGIMQPFGINYERVIEATGVSIEFWRMVSAFAVTLFVVKALDVFDEIRKMQLKALQNERDLAQKIALETQISARETAERWTDALVNINRQIADLEHVDNILLGIAENARQLLKSNFLGIALLDEARTGLHLKCYSITGETQIVNTPIPVENELVLDVFQNCRYYRSGRVEPAGVLENAYFFVDCDPKTLAGVYLNLDNSPIGAMWVTGCDDSVYSEEDLIWLECMADQVVIAIQHGLMTSQLQSFSVTEERARIAREMHDGLAQVLGYLNLQVQTIEALYVSGKSELLKKELKHMRQAIKTAHGDVRENILSLRTTLADEKGLLSAVEEYLKEFGIQTGVKTDVSINHQQDINLSSIAEVQLVCILQEALANVRKHAEAEHVHLNIYFSNTGEDDSPGYVEMRVIDDGNGFVMSDSKRRFGLKTMQERATSVDGELMVDSKVGEGTVVTCRIPCLKPESISSRSIVLS